MLISSQNDDPVTLGFTSAKLVAKTPRSFNASTYSITAWAGGRAVECTGLENRQGCKPFVGSNPTLPATIITELSNLRPTHAVRICVVAIFHFSAADPVLNSQNLAVYEDLQERDG